jgi:FKBP-type peptidyl-prolyl cis-trans isomerase FklB
MRRLSAAAVGIVCLTVLACVPFISCRAGQEPGAPRDKATAPERPAAELKSDKQKGSYSIGYTIGNNIRHQLGGGDTLDMSAFLLGMQEALSAGKPSLGTKERSDAQRKFIVELTRQKAESASVASKTNRQKQDDFLAANKKKKGVNTTATGLQYIILKEGTGKQPKATDRVKVHYHGTLLNDTVFDSSRDRGQPMTFAVNGVVPGFAEALQMMKEGSKWRVYIPSDLAYGQNGKGPIGPNEMLIFEIELLKVNGD